VNIVLTVKASESKILEQSRDGVSSGSALLMERPKWCKPSCESIKLNVDVAMINNIAALAVVARGDDGKVLKAWTKLVQLDDPLVAEAAAALWALDLAISKKFQNI
jgi:hypothetical protein